MPKAQEIEPNAHVLGFEPPYPMVLVYSCHLSPGAPEEMRWLVPRLAGSFLFFIFWSLDLVHVQHVQQKSL